MISYYNLEYLEQPKATTIRIYSMAACLQSGDFAARQKIKFGNFSKFQNPDLTITQSSMQWNGHLY